MRIHQYLMCYCLATVVTLSVSCENEGNGRKTEEKISDGVEVKDGLDANKISRLASYGLGDLVGQVEGYERLSSEKLDVEIEKEYKRLGIDNSRSAYKNPNSMNGLCTVAKLMEKQRVLSSMVRCARGDLQREEFMMLCVGVGSLPILTKIQREWAEDVDYQKKQHLVGLVVYLSNAKEVAREIVGDRRFGVKARCTAASILAEKGSLKDIEFLKKHYEEINPQKEKYRIDGKVYKGALVDHGGSILIDDCAKMAVEKLQSRIKK